MPSPEHVSSIIYRIFAALAGRHPTRQRGQIPRAASRKPAAGLVRARLVPSSSPAKRAWARVITSAPSHTSTGWDLEGPWLPLGCEVDLRPGTVAVVATYPVRFDIPSVRVMLLEPNGSWSLGPGYAGRSWARSLTRALNQAKSQHDAWMCAFLEAFTVCLRADRELEDVSVEQVA